MQRGLHLKTRSESHYVMSSIDILQIYRVRVHLVSYYRFIKVTLHSHHRPCFEVEAFSNSVCIQIQHKEADVFKKDLSVIS